MDYVTIEKDAIKALDLKNTFEAESSIRKEMQMIRIRAHSKKEDLLKMRGLRKTLARIKTHQGSLLPSKKLYKKRNESV
jgi:hypothetical protein